MNQILSEKSIEDLMSLLTIEQKLSQLFIVGYSGTEISQDLKDWVNNYLGGLVFFRENIEGPEQISSTISNLQLISTLGLFTAIDQEGGLVERIKGVTQVPSAMALAAVTEEGSVSIANEIIAQELSLLGFNLNFSPVMDVNSNPDNPVIGIRSFGDTPARVAEYGLKVIEAMRKHNIIPVAKHFPGHGPAKIDSHLDLPEITTSYEDLCHNHFFPFQDAIASDVEMIMVCHANFKEITERDRMPASLSDAVISDLLFDKMAYEGVVITDDMNMKAITRMYSIKKSSEMAFMAGNDILLYRNYKDARIAYNLLLAQVKTGKISQERLNQSLRKILKLKAKYSIIKNLYIADNAKISIKIKSSENLAIAETLFDKGITVLKHGILDKLSKKLVVSANKQELTHYKSEDETLLSDLIDDADEIRFSISPTEEQEREILTVIDDYDEIIVISYNACFNKAQAGLIKEIVKVSNVFGLAAGSPYDASIFEGSELIALSYGYSNGSIMSFSKLLTGEIEGNETPPVNIVL